MLAVFDMAGRNIVTRECALKQYGATPIALTLGKGAYLAKVEVNGMNAGNVKIFVP
jgi:hypothetical protein